MPNTDYAPRALSPSEARVWNHRNDHVATGPGEEIQRITAGDLDSLEVTGWSLDDAHNRVMALIAEGYSAATAVATVRSAILRRANARPRKTVLPTVGRPETHDFTASYGKAGNWVPSHHRSRIEDFRPAHIAQRRV